MSLPLRAAIPFVAVVAAACVLQGAVWQPMPATAPATERAAAPATPSEIRSGHVSFDRGRRAATHPSSQGGTIPDHVPLSLPVNVRWQFASPKIVRVVPDPKHRLWYQLRDQSAVPTVDEAKTLIAREFTQPDPQLTNIRPLLFEPGGRAWFLVYGAHQQRSARFNDAVPTFLGYDGATFIERPAPPDASFSDYASANGQFEADHSTAYADGAAFFGSASSVYSFDGHAWSSRDFATDNRGSRGVQLYPEPDGKGMVVLAGSTDSLWRWHDKKWTAIKLAAAPGDQRFGGETSGTPLGIAPVPTGLWLLTRQGLSFIPWTGQQTHTTAELIAQLKSDDYKAREAATEELIERGRPILPDIQQALDANHADESRYRLDYILHQLETYQPRQGIKTSVGPYLVSNPLFLTTLANGTALLGVKSLEDVGGKAITTRTARPIPPKLRQNQISNESPGGLLKIDPSGTVTLLGGEDLLAAFVEPSPGVTFAQSLSSVPLLNLQGDAAWIVHHNQEVITLLDLQAGKILKQSASPRVQAPVAVAEDGTVFLRSLEGTIAYQPESPENRLPLPIAGSIDGTYLARTGDGAIWCFDSHGQLQHWNAAAAGAVAVGTSRFSFQSVIPGQHDLLTESRNHWQLITPTGATPLDNLEDAIAAKPSSFAEFSSAPADPRRMEATYAIEADLAGNIWLLNRPTQTLKVFSNGQWIDSVDALMKAGYHAGRITTIARIGAGSKIFAIGPDLGYAGGPPHSFVGACTQGHLTFDPLPDTLMWGNSLDTLTTPSGDLWLEHQDVQNGRSDAVLLTEKGTSQTVDNLLPFACDGAGNLWGTPTVRDGVVWSDPANPPLVVVRGKERSILPSIGHAPTIYSPLITPPSGRVFRQTALGFMDVTPSPALATAPAVPSPIYFIPGLPPASNLVGAVAQSNALVYQSHTASGLQLSVVRLPEH